MRSLPRRKFLLLRWASFFFLFAGVLGVSYAALVILSGEAFQAIELHRFEHRAPTAEPHLPIFGEVLGELQIPRIGLRAVVMQGDSRNILDRAVGHLPRTALPGEVGNVALAGHRDRLFRPLREIRDGDIILLQTPGETFQYQVQTAFVVPGTEVSVLQPTQPRELTLITCYPFNFIGHAPNRFIVRARQVAAQPR
ncbi:MAG TPA: class D sortase [Candidatus Acidoferrum sp.]|nr:class D sortase [Candidatus Acidoferrum sp.]